MKGRSLVTGFVAGAASVVAAAVAVVGVAHTDWGRPLLAVIAGGCPVSLDGADPEQVEAFRVSQLKRVDGTTRAASHPALRFQLGVTRWDDVQRDLPGCVAKREQSVLWCTGAAAQALTRGSAGADAHLQFDGAGRLVAVDVLHEVSSAAQALAHVTAAEASVAAAVGPVTRSHGRADPEYLSAPYRRYAREYRYDHYVAVLSVTHLGQRGLRVREQYQWAAAQSGS